MFVVVTTCSPLRVNGLKPHQTHSDALPQESPHNAPCSLVNLGRQIKLQESILTSLKVILHKERGVGSQSQFHRPAERCCLREIHQIPQCKGRRDGLMDCQGNSVLCFLTLSWLQHHIATTCITLHTEGNAFL